MSNDLETIRRIKAWHDGKPTPRGAVINTHVADDDDVLVMSFLRMGGESRPWGVAIGTLATGPTVFTVPEARNRQLVADMMVEAAPVLLAHFRHPKFDADGPGGYQVQSLRQIWLPGPTHLEMLHFLAAAYARTKWNHPEVAILNALGNLCNALFIEAQRPGQQVVMSAVDALRSAYVFPTSSIRQAHLGHLLGWLRGGRSRDERWNAAHDAERESVSTVLDPELERRDVAPLVAEWGSERSDQVAQNIRAALEPELLRRWSLTAAAIAELRRDRRTTNAGVAELVTNSARSFFYAWGDRALNEEAGLQPFWPNVFTDHNARSASGSFHARVADDETSRYALMHGDRELQREELAKGHGVLATVRSNTVNEWLIAYSYPELTTIEPGRTLAIAGRPSMTLTVTEVNLDERTMTLTPGWKLAKKIPGPNTWASDNTKWRGAELVLLFDQPTKIMRNRITMARQGVDNDITLLLTAPPPRHAAFDDDGAVFESVEADS